MVHAIKLGWKIGFGLLSEHVAARAHALLEAGYLIGSLLFTVGTLFFFPLEGLEDFVVGCRFYEVGSVVFALLTGYSELDRWHARRQDSRDVTKRELLEQMLYCAGSFVFLVGTFFFDPPCVDTLSELLSISKSHIENTAALLFMVGSFMFSLGAYVNALSIFEAPRMFRRHLVIVTSSYMFGGLLFIAGTMGYVEAFEPNLKLRWCATWFYLVGCLFYVNGSGLSFISTVARNQVRFERIQDQEQEKNRRLARLLSRATSALPRAFKRSKRGKKQAAQQDDGEGDGASVEDGDEATFDEADLEAAADEAGVEDMDLDLEVVERRMSAKLASVLGPEVGRELVAALQDADGLGEEEDEDVFGAFFRAVDMSFGGSGAMAPTSGDAGDKPPSVPPSPASSRKDISPVTAPYQPPSPAAEAEPDAVPASSSPEKDDGLRAGARVIGASENHSLGLLEAREN